MNDYGVLRILAWSLTTDAVKLPATVFSHSRFHHDERRTHWRYLTPPPSQHSQPQYSHTVSANQSSFSLFSHFINFRTNHQQRNHTSSAMKPKPPISQRRSQFGTRSVRRKKCRKKCPNEASERSALCRRRKPIL